MEQFDTIIIGSGLGGLECAYTLAKEGQSVCVLEKNQQFGGCLQSFKSHGVTFDTGVHYVGGLDEGQALHTYFKYFGIMDKLKIKKMDKSGFEQVSFDGDTRSYKYGMGYDNFVDSMCEYFPNDSTEILNYTKRLKELADKYPLYNLKYDKMPEALNFEYLDESILSYFSNNISNPKLRNVLGGTNLLYAGEPDISTFYEHGLIINSYIESAYRFINGSGQIANALVRNIRKMGGIALRYRKVEKIVCDEHSNAQYVLLSTGEKYFAKNFISNIHPTMTMNMVEGMKIRKSYTNRLNAIPNSSSAFALHIAFKKDSFRYFNHNIYHFTDNDIWKSMHYTDTEWPKSYMALTPPSSQNDEYAEGMIAIAYMHYDEVAKWGNVENTVGFEEDRGADYEEFKIQKSEKLIDELENKFPGIRNHIDGYCSSTPLTYRDYLYTPEGSIYGYMKDYNNPLKAYISPMTKVRNLYFTGQNVNMHGVMGVTVSSIITCGALLGTNYLLKKVIAAK